MPTKKKLLPSSQISTQIATGKPERDYELFMQNLDVVGIGLTSCVCNIDRSAYFKLKSKTFSFHHEYQLVKITEEYFDSEGKFAVSLRGGKTSPPILFVECAFRSHIHGKKPILREHAERFTNSELRLVLVPYARQFVANLTSQMYIPTVTLPLAVRVNDPKDSAE